MVSVAPNDEDKSSIDDEFSSYITSKKNETSLQVNEDDKVLSNY